MKLSLNVSNSPIVVRMIYDLFSSLLAAMFSFVMIGTNELHHSRYGIFLAPVFLLILNAILGVYTRLRSAKGEHKFIVLVVSIFCSTVACNLSGASVRQVVAWFVVVLAPIILPRLMLYLKLETKRKFNVGIANPHGPILIVGGAGYIGTHVVSLLLQEGRNVRVLDRLIHGVDSIKDFLGNKNFELIEGDATDIVKLLTAMNGASAVIHLGGLVGDPACSVDEAFTRHANVIATRMVKDTAMSLGIQRLIFASSCSVYGSTTSEVNECSPLNPVSLYAKTKIDSEVELLAQSSSVLCTTVLRFATVFGHSRRPRFDLVANLFTAQAFFDGLINVTGSNQWRPFVHVKDLAKVVVKILSAPKDVVQGQIFNVGDKNLNMTIGRLAEIVQKNVSTIKAVEIKYKDDIHDRRNYAVSFEKLWNTFNLEPFISIEDGIKEIIDMAYSGEYSHYQKSQYSNLEMTRKVLSEFRDPEKASRLYRPVFDSLEVFVQ